MYIYKEGKKGSTHAYTDEQAQKIMLPSVKKSYPPTSNTKNEKTTKGAMAHDGIPYSKDCGPRLVPYMHYSPELIANIHLQLGFPT